jgi:hypothetical protein
MADILEHPGFKWNHLKIVPKRGMVLAKAWQRGTSHSTKKSMSDEHALCFNQVLGESGFDWPD